MGPENKLKPLGLAAEPSLGPQIMLSKKKISKREGMTQVCWHKSEAEGLQVPDLLGLQSQFKPGQLSETLSQSTKQKESLASDLLVESSMCEVWSSVLKTRQKEGTPGREHPGCGWLNSFI